MNLEQKIIHCQKCTRLRAYCEKVAQEKRKSFLADHYWGKPVPSLGDLSSELYILGLAPAAHGGNRTGRIFTGDKSGEWLYRALYKQHFANQPTSTHKEDHLKLFNCYISCVVRCAPPKNKPLPEETKNCLPYLKEELDLMRNIKVFIALGRFAYEELWRLIQPKTKRPPFTHGKVIQLTDKNQILILSYHPSQQNTFTGKLTEEMFDTIFIQARQYLL